MTCKDKVFTKNCLLITNDNQLYGQVLKSDAESTIEYLNKHTDFKWRIDTHEYIFCLNPAKDVFGINMFNNPLRAEFENFVFITCVPEDSECSVINNDSVVIDPHLLNTIDYPNISDEIIKKS